MFSKLGIVNTCLALSGNATVNVEDDGSDEWLCASEAYESAVKYLLSGHDWKFGTQITSPMRVGDSDDEAYEDAYAKPANSLGLVWVKVDGYPIDYKVVGNRIVVNADDGLKVKYVLQPDPESWPPLFVEALNCLVKAGIYEGLNEDPDEARKLRAEAEIKLQQARTRSDAEQARRPAFVSTMLQRRRGRVIGSRV